MTEQPTERPGLLRRVVKSAIAPDVLEDGGKDAPLTPRGRIIFWGVVSVLVIAIAVLFVVTLARKYLPTTPCDGAFGSVIRSERLHVMERLEAFRGGCSRSRAGL
jgi:hypothetical protein